MVEFFHTLFVEFTCTLGFFCIFGLYRYRYREIIRSQYHFGKLGTTNLADIYKEVEDLFWKNIVINVLITTVLAIYFRRFAYELLGFFVTFVTSLSFSSLWMIKTSLTDIKKLMGETESENRLTWLYDLRSGARMAVAINAISLSIGLCISISSRLKLIEPPSWLWVVGFFFSAFPLFGASLAVSVKHATKHYLANPNHKVRPPST